MVGRKDELVAEIKDLQRRSPDHKQAWWEFCDRELGGVRDPARHDPAVLGDFLDMIQGSGPRRPSPGKGGGGGGPPMGGKGSKGPPRGAGSFGAGSFGAGSFGGGKAMGGPVVGGGGGPTFASYAPSYAPSAKGGFMGGMAPMGGMGAPMGAAPGGVVDLVSFIKTGQKMSRHWKNAWGMYVQSQGSDRNDPALHDDGFIIGFLDYIGECVEAQIGASGGASRGPAGRRDAGEMRPGDWVCEKCGDLQFAKNTSCRMCGAPKGDADGGAPPPAKRARAVPERSTAGPASSEKEMLVQRVKDFQRRDADSKELWWSFCDSEHRGVRDPARHDEDVLREFLDSYDTGAAEAGEFMDADPPMEEPPFDEYEN
eukprot:TRINITY_DN12_c0_g1_i1.p1 TRINITY_DN12_c0_g1~~TRINITY_DN12_c0_g1_i1.p1  ORF type:complete len:369 (+),score=96.46 TRINITY_DN12_c0_g1_i1:95-1201(+)